MLSLSKHGVGFFSKLLAGQRRTKGQRTDESSIKRLGLLSAHLLSVFNATAPAGARRALRRSVVGGWPPARCRSFVYSRPTLAAV